MGRSPLEQLAVVVPVGPGDRAWRELAPDLGALPREAEIVFSAAEAIAPEAAPLLQALPGARWLEGPTGRARQLNLGARAASRRWLWFVHADSRLPEGALAALERSIAAEPEALHYFDLRFRDDGPRWMRLNERGARFRSRWLGMPFGDQGLCLAREAFERLGGFPEDAPYGEDHLLVWRARQAGMRLRGTGAPIDSSARKYQERGWLATTCRHLALTARQAAPEAWKLLSRPRARSPRDR